MLISFVYWFLGLHIFFLFSHTVLFSVKCIKKRKKNMSLSVSNGTYYLCSILSIVVTTALYLNVMDYDESIIWFYIIFGIATIVSIPLMLWTAFWKIEYDDRILVYRNILGIRRVYDINKISLIHKKQYTTIMYNNQKITDYNFMLLDIEAVKAFENFVKH